MDQIHRAPFGVSLSTAVDLARAAVANDERLFRRMGYYNVKHILDFHGLGVQVDLGQPAEALIAEVEEAYRNRCDLYAMLPVPEDAFEQEQHGRMGESLEECVLPAVQCGQRWGNLYMQGDTPYFERMRHVFEFNGIRVPFNPWAVSEHERVYREALEQIAERRAVGDNVPNVVVPAQVPELEGA